MLEIGKTHSGIMASRDPNRRPSERNPETVLRHLRGLACITLFLLSSLMAGVCHAQGRDVICKDGTGEFEALSHTGVTVRVGAARNEGLAARICEATLSWADQKLVVAPAAVETDIDAFGVDMGLGAPVVAVQVKKAKDDCCMRYDIYSLREPPTLLHSIHGGGFFSAADTDLDGRVQIWTDDAAAVDGFENLSLRDLDFPPPVVLRFVGGKLTDDSIEFQPYYDQKIANERGQLSPQDLADFKNSDGKLTSYSGIPPVRLVQLRKVKMRVLEIVWSYLYSGREKEALRSLDEMWPAADLNRIREALLNARAHGIRTQVSSVATSISSSHWPHVAIFDGTTSVAAPTPGLAPKGYKPKPEMISPKAILMERPQPATVEEIELSQNESTLELVIDAAGKVRSATVIGTAQADEGLIKSTANWKFIPAFSGDDAVASRIYLGVSLKK